MVAEHFDLNSVADLSEAMATVARNGGSFLRGSPLRVTRTA